MTTLNHELDPKANGLNLLRLILASMVIVTHGAVITGWAKGSNGIFDPLVGELPVDGFFVLSGFLVAGSWIRTPDVRSFLIARCSRIYPAYWTCLAITALLIAPLTTWASGGSWRHLLAGPSELYMALNSTLVVVQNGIGGTPLGGHFPHDWNASLWTLKWEFLCYLAVLVLGVCGLLRKRRLHLLAALILVVLSQVVATGDFPKVAHDVARFGLCYEAGILAFLFQNRIKVAWWAIVASFALVVASAAWTADYRVLGIWPLGYALLGLGAKLRPRVFRLENDFSYGMYVYGFPVEQSLALVHGATALQFLVFSAVAAVCTIPLAVFSWFVIERPALAAARKRRVRRSSARDGARASPDAAEA